VKTAIPGQNGPSQGGGESINDVTSLGKGVKKLRKTCDGFGGGPSIRKLEEPRAQNGTNKPVWGRGANKVQMDGVS